MFIFLVMNKEIKAFRIRLAFLIPLAFLIEIIPSVLSHIFLLYSVWQIMIFTSIISIALYTLVSVLVISNDRTCLNTLKTLLIPVTILLIVVLAINHLLYSLLYYDVTAYFQADTVSEMFDLLASSGRHQLLGRATLVLRVLEQCAVYCISVSKAS